MTMTMILPWVLGVVGVLGVGGTIAAAFLFPAIVIPVLESIVAFIMKCKPCLYAIALIAACSAAWWHGHHTAVLACRQDELSAELRNKQIDLDNAKKSAANEASRASKIEADANDRQTKDAAYIEQLKNRPDPLCVLDDPDLRGLRNHKSRPGRAKPAAHSR
jgi:hypothetical protein